EPQIAQSTSLPEGPIRTISPEILESILFLTNHSESTRFVSHIWNDLTFTAAKNSKNQELKQTIPLIIEKLNPGTHAECIADLAELQEAHRSLSDYVTTFAEVQRLFLIEKGLVIGILRKLPVEERDQLQEALDEELPDSMKDLFEISKLNLRTVKNINLDTFFTLLQSYQPLSKKDRGEAVVQAAEINNLDFVKLLLANGPISKLFRGAAVDAAAKSNNIELVKLLLANGAISEIHREYAVLKAAKNNNLELFKLLLADGPISEWYRGVIVMKAAANIYNKAIVRLILAKGSIIPYHRGLAVEEAAKNDNQDLLQLLID
ncbi:MAG: ankyrin repeat domain-containing protein, partial [Chlamydiales bacterium]